jgi:hypothetical protein
VRLSPLDTAATVWPIVPARDDRWWWVWSSRWNANWQGKPKYSEKICPSSTMSTKNPTWPLLGSNPGGPVGSRRLTVQITTRPICNHRYFYQPSWCCCRGIRDTLPRRRHLDANVLRDWATSSWGMNCKTYVIVWIQVAYGRHGHQSMQVPSVQMRKGIRGEAHVNWNYPNRGPSNCFMAMDVILRMATSTTWRWAPSA